MVLKLYKLLFRHDPADVREDERAEAALLGARRGAREVAAGSLGSELQKQVGAREVVGLGLVGWIVSRIVVEVDRIGLDEW